jgi:hypothetical protein
MYIADAKQLAQLLREAALAHHTFEAMLGHRDENWPDWYAAHIVAELKSRDAETASHPVLK